MHAFQKNYRHERCVCVKSRYATAAVKSILCFPKFTPQKFKFLYKLPMQCNDIYAVRGSVKLRREKWERILFIVRCARFLLLTRIAAVSNCIFGEDLKTQFSRNRECETKREARETKRRPFEFITCLNVFWGNTKSSMRGCFLIRVRIIRRRRKM